MKDYLRDYATAAFRYFAANGKSAENYKTKIYNEALERIQKREKNPLSIGKPTEAAIIEAEDAVNQKIAEINDMEAVERVLIQLNNSWRRQIVEAIELVYFVDPDQELCKNDIQDRVKAASMEIPASERAIYYWLRQARDAFAKERGLRLKNF